MLPKRDTLLTGRQVVFLILQEFKSTSDLDRHYSVLELEKLRWQGDAPQEIEKFLNDVEEMRDKLHPDTSQKEVAGIIVDRMELCKLPSVEVKIDKWKEYRQGHKKKLLIRPSVSSIDTWINTRRRNLKRNAMLSLKPKG